jgi:hypothetical protein
VPDRRRRRAPTVGRRTDLVVGTRQGKWLLPESLVALDRIAELRGVAQTSWGASG